MSLIIPLLIAIPIATKQCTFEGVRYFFFNKTWIFHGSLWNLTPSSFQYLDGWTERGITEKVNIHREEANNASPIERGGFVDFVLAKIYAQRWMIVSLLLDCDASTIDPLSRSFYRHWSQSRASETATSYPTAAIINYSLVRAKFANFIVRRWIPWL